MTQRKHFIGNVYPTNQDGDVTLLKIDSGTAHVRFHNTGFEREVLMGNLMAGKCMDTSVTSPRLIAEKTYPNLVMSSNTYGDFIVLEKQSKNCIIQFVNTGYTRKALWDNVKNGKVSDPYAVTNYSVGFHGEYPNKPYTAQAKQLWRNMLKRCYSEKDTRGYYGKGVTVDQRWLCYANFQEDLPKLENFDKWVSAKKTGSEPYNLDKDFKITGNKVYSKEACMFLPESLNKSLGSRNKWASTND